MALLPRFDTPAFLRDAPAGSPFYTTWSNFIATGLVDLSPGDNGGAFYDPTQTDVNIVAQKTLTWIGFPRDVLLPGNRDNKPAAFAAADADIASRDPQNEYFEWYVTRNSAGKITKLTFVTETPSRLWVHDEWPRRDTLPSYACVLFDQFSHKERPCRTTNGTLPTAMPSDFTERLPRFVWVSGTHPWLLQHVLPVFFSPGTARSCCNTSVIVRSNRRTVDRLELTIEVPREITPSGDTTQYALVPIKKGHHEDSCGNTPPSAGCTGASPGSNVC